MDQATVDDAPGLNSGDRDALIRTVLTEGAQSDPRAWASVAAVVRNRLATGGYGSSVSQIVKAPGQFEVWQNGRAQGVDPNTDAYQRAGRVVDAIAAGLPDPTNGATHFFSPAGQAALGRTAPSWGGKNVTAVMGGHVYSAPNGRVDLGIMADPQPAAPASQPQAKASAPMANSDPLKRWGVSLDDDGSTAAAAPRRQLAAQGDTLSRWGVSLDDTPAAPVSATAQARQATPAIAVGAPTAAPVAAGDSAAAVGRGILNGAPVVGPYILGGVNRVAAAARAITKDEPYSQALQEVQSFGDATAAEHPIATGIGQAGGAGLAMAPIAAAAPVAFGLRGATMAGQMLTGGATNAALGAADATARGDNPLMGAGMGLAGGSLGPLAGRVGSSIVGGALTRASNSTNALTNYLRTGSGSGIPGVGRAAAGMVNTLIGADGQQSVQNALAKYGPDAMLADAGPSLTTIAGGLARRPAAEGSTVVDALNARAAGANDRIATQIDTSLGPAESPAQAAANVKAARSAVNAGYDAVHAGAPPIDASSVVDLIDAKLSTATGSQRTALQRLRDELVKTPAVTDPTSGTTTDEVLNDSSELLHNVRKDLDAVIQGKVPGLGVEKGAVSSNNRSLQDVRAELDGVLKDQVPGMADLDAKSAALAERQNAVDSGFNDVLGGNAPHPDDFAAQRAANAPGVNIAQNKGIRGRVDRMFGTGTQRDAVTLNKLLAGGEDGYAAANLGTAFGEEPKNALLDVLAREKQFNDTTQTVTRNSVTGRVAEANKLLDATAPGNLDLKNATPTGLALQAGKSAIVDPIVKMIMESPDAPRNLEVARMLVAQGASRDQIFTALQRLASRQSVVSRASGALSGAVNSGLNRLLLAAGATQRPSFDPAR